MKRILPVFLLLFLTACQTDQPTVESVNAAEAAKEGRCEQQGYKRGSKDFYTCLQLAAAQQAQQQANAAYTPGAAQLGIAAGMAALPLLFLSDENAKRDITLVGKQNGFNLYRFRYLDDDQLYIGVLAQEVARKRPDAVVKGADGYLRVNYSKIGIKFKRTAPN